MKPQRPAFIQFLTLCIAPAVAGLTHQSAQAASATWDGGAATTELTTATNWTADVAPTASGDTATWNGTAAGDLVLTWTGVFSAGFGAVGTSVDVTSAQTSSLLIGSSSATGVTNADSFNIGNLTLASGAGPFTFGDGVGLDNMIFRSLDATPVNTLTNNSSNTATFASNVNFNSGGGLARTFTFEGSGNWQVNSPLRFVNNAALTIVKNGAGTLTLSGGPVAGGTTAHTINGGILKVAGTGLLGGANTLAGNIINNATLSYESSASQTLSGIISGSGTFHQSAGALTLSGINTYSGATTINGGSFNVSGTGSIESSSGITVNGPTAKYLHTSTTASTRNITLTQGTVGGTGTIGAVAVANGTGLVANGNGDSAALTIDSLTFNGAGAISVTDDSDPGTSGVNVSGTLTTTPANGQITVNASNSFWNAGTTYGLVTAGTFGGVLSDFTKGTINGLTSRQSASLVLNGSTLGLLIGGDSPRWSGLDNSNWVVGSTGANGNWRLINGNIKTDFIQGDVVLFNDLATNTTVTISAAHVSPAIVNFDNSSKNYTVNGAFGISAGALNKSGTGTVTISTANSYNGGTTINSGTLTLSGSGTLGDTSGALTAVNGTLNLGGTVQTVGSLAITGEGHIENGTLAATGLTVSNPFGSAEISAGLDLGSGNLSKTGDGTLTLGGVTTSSGTATISGGTLTLGGSGYLDSTGTVTLGGGMLDLGGKTIGMNTVIIGAASPLYGETIVNGSIEPSSIEVTSTSGVAGITANIEGSTGITVSGATGIFRLTGENTFTGPLNITGPATVLIDGGSNSGGGAISYNSFGTTFTINAGAYSTSGISANSNSAFRLLNLNGGVLESAGNVFADTLAISVIFNGGTLKSGSAAGITVFDSDNLIQVSGGGATFDTTTGNIAVGNNTHAQAIVNLPRINGSAGGVVTLMGGNTLVSGITNTEYLEILDNSTWDLNGIPSSVAGLSGNGSVTSSVAGGVLTINTFSELTYSGVIAGGINLSLVKLGDGKQILSGINTYQGNTTVTAGILEVSSNSATTFANGSTVSIAAGAVLHLPNATTDVVASLVLDGVAQPEGFVYDSSTPGGYITGSGKIEVGGAVAGGYDSWATDKGLTAGVNDGTSQDPDFDGIPNLLEYVLGGEPIGAGAANTSILPVQTLDTTNVTLTFHRSDLSEADTTQVVQISADLATWTNFATVGAATAAPVTVTEDSPTADLDTVSVVIPRAGNAVNGKLFTRVQAVKQP